MKISQLQNYLRKKKISYLFLTNNDPNFTYFTKLKGLSFSLLFIPQKNKPFLFVTSLDKEKKSAQVKTVLIKKPWQDSIKKYIRPGSLAYNSQVLTIHQYKEFQKVFPKIRFKDFSKILFQLRAEKTSLEIRNIRKAAQFTVQAFNQIIFRLKKKQFKKEKDIELFLQTFALSHNLRLSFPSIVASAINSKNPHHQTSGQKLRKGFLLLDFGFTYQNYCSDMSRMLYLGKPTKKELTTYNFLLKVQKETIKNLKPGLKAGSLDQQARRALGKYSSYFTHGLGHGLGVEIHEFPSLSPDSKDGIRANQTFTIEPGLYFKKFGLRIEDTILMKEKPIILTKARKELVMI